MTALFVWLRENILSALLSLFSRWISKKVQDKEPTKPPPGSSRVTAPPGLITENETTRTLRLIYQEQRAKVFGEVVDEDVFVFRVQSLDWNHLRALRVKVNDDTRYWDASGKVFYSRIWNAAIYTKIKRSTFRKRVAEHGWSVWDALNKPTYAAQRGEHIVKAT